MSTSGRLYYSAVSAIGIILFIIAIFSLTPLPQIALFIILQLLSLLLATQSVIVKNTVSIDLINALALAAAPVWGVWPTIFLVILSSIATSIVIGYQQNQVSWRPIVRRALFNIGAVGTAAFVSILILRQGLQVWGANSKILQLMFWLLAAIVYDQINLWLVAGIVGFTSSTRPAELWWSQRWAMPVNIITAAVGGRLLSYAMQQLSIPGLLAFFVPIIVSMYSFRLYVYQTDKKMRELEGIVRERTEELTALLYEKDAFLGVLQHDMHTILATIRLYTTLLRDKPNLTETDRQRYINIILRSERELLSIADNILEIERLTVEPHGQLEWQRFELDKLMSEVVAAATVQALAKNIMLRRHPMAVPIYVYADKEKIRLILSNLLSNSIKFSHKDGQVDLSCNYTNTTVTIKIKDNGHGIPAAELDHIFKKYYRLEQHKLQAHGTGLGLAIVHNLVEAHGGRIEVCSTENKGSTFTIHLPIVVDSKALPSSKSSK